MEYSKLSPPEPGGVRRRRSRGVVWEIYYKTYHLPPSFVRGTPPDSGGETAGMNNLMNIKPLTPLRLDGYAPRGWSWKQKLSPLGETGKGDY